MPLPVNQTIDLEASVGGVPCRGRCPGTATSGKVDVILFAGTTRPSIEVTNRDAAGDLWVRVGQPAAGDDTTGIADPVAEGAGLELVRAGETVAIRADVSAGSRNALKILRGPANTTGLYYVRRGQS